MVHEYFNQKIHRWSHSYYEYAEDLFCLNESVRNLIQAVEFDDRKTRLNEAVTKANALHVAMQLMRFFRPDYPLLIPEIQRMHIALLSAERNGDIVPEIHSALAIMVAAEAAMWFRAAWPEAEDSRSTAATPEDIRKAYHAVLEDGHTPTKERVGEKLRAEYGVTIGTNKLNLELRQLRKSESGPPNKPD